MSDARCTNTAIVCSHGGGASRVLSPIDAAQPRVTIAT